jgi:hypothetical protein
MREFSKAGGNVSHLETLSLPAEPIAYAALRKAARDSHWRIEDMFQYTARRDLSRRNRAKDGLLIW